MELGTSITIVGLAFSGIGIFAIIMRFLSANSEIKSQEKERGGQEIWATRQDITTLESRMDALRQEVRETIDQGVMRIHQKLDERERRCSKRGQRIAAVEREIELASPRPPSKGSNPDDIGFRRRSSDPQVSPEEETNYPYTCCQDPGVCEQDPGACHSNLEGKNDAR